MRRECTGLWQMGALSPLELPRIKCGELDQRIVVAGMPGPLLRNAQLFGGDVFQRQLFAAFGPSELLCAIQKRVCDGMHRGSGNGRQDGNAVPHGLTAAARLPFGTLAGVAAAWG